MGKQVKAKSEKNNGASENQLRATALVKNFCEKKGIVLTSKYAQLKQMTSKGGSQSMKITMWGEKDGQKGLVTMDVAGTGGKFCSETQLAKDYANMHTIKF